MTNRVPLIVDSLNQNVKELPVGDNLDLTGSNIVGVVDFTASGVVTGNIASSSVTITGGTINGTSIGATTASTGAFTSGTFSGNVGIGTSSPSVPLDVVGRLFVSSDGNSPDAAIKAEVFGAVTSGLGTNTGSTAARKHWKLSVNNSEVGFVGTAGSDLTIGTNNAERMRIFSDGGIRAATGDGWVGDVSASGYSAVIQRGSNVNGEFVRFADGTQICVRSCTVDHASTGVQVFPWAAAFAGVPGGGWSFSGTSNLARIDRLKNCIAMHTVTNASIAIGTGGTAAETLTHVAYAVGRWR